RTNRGHPAAPGPVPRPRRRRARAGQRRRARRSKRTPAQRTTCPGRRPGYPLRDDGAMRMSTRGDYAARALLSLALHGSDRPTSVKEIAERTSLPQPYLEQILLAVKGAGLVRSKRGVGGGYVLARDPSEITLADIVGAVEGPQ